MPQTTEENLPIALPEPTGAETGLPPSAEPASDKSDVNWDDFSGEQDSGDNVEEVEGDLEVLEPAPTAEPAPTEEQKTSAPVESPQQTPAPVIQPPLPSSTPEPVAPVPAATIPSPAPFDAAAWEAEQVSRLEKMYAIPEADAEKLQTEPELMLPKLAANMHLSLTKSLLTAVQSIIPEMIANQQSLQAADTEARTAFYSANPDLNDPKYENAVLQVAKIYRAANPTASRAEAVKTIGEMTRMSLGLVPAAPAPAPTPSNTPALLQPARQVPFSPARGGGAAAPNKAPSVWDEMSRDD